MRLAVRDRLVRRLLALGPRFASGERTGELANTLVGGVEALDAYLAQYLPQVVPRRARARLLVLAAVLWGDPLSALVLLADVPARPALHVADRRRGRRSARARQWVTLSRLAARFLDALAGLATLRAFGRADDEARVLARASERHRAVTMGVLRLAFVSALVLEALATLGTAVVAVEVGLRLLYARIEFREALFVLVLAPEFYRPLRALGAAFHAGMAGREAAARIARDRSRPRGRSPRPRSWPATPPPRAPRAARRRAGRRASAFERVRFAYDAGRDARARRLLARAPGRRDASRSSGRAAPGKTTAAHLLLRFLEPGRGPRSSSTARRSPRSRPEEWRRRVAWVPQRPRLFHGTRAREPAARRGPSASDARVAERCELGPTSTALLRELPRGLETPVGEGGERLSGGEAQRVALARAFLKDAPVLVLDEPTAQLDPETEAAVVEAIERLRRGRTVLLVAHRLTTVAARRPRRPRRPRPRRSRRARPRQLARVGRRATRGSLAAWEGAP